MEKLIGDGVFAVFGVPHVHEDDAERAICWAGGGRDADVLGGAGRLRDQIPKL